MITYELAKQLKEAGFPQEGKGLFLSKVTIYGSKPSIVNNPELAYAPTLPELIEACGDMFGALILSKKGWIALNNEENYLIEYQNRATKTPEEAIAKLWLKLNEK